MRVKFTLSVFPCILEILLLSLRGHEADDDHERHADKDHQRIHPRTYASRIPGFVTSHEKRNTYSNE